MKLIGHKHLNSVINVYKKHSPSQPGLETLLGQWQQLSVDLSIVIKARIPKSKVNTLNSVLKG